MGQSLWSAYVVRFLHYHIFRILGGDIFFSLSVSDVFWVLYFLLVSVLTDRILVSVEFMELFYCLHYSIHGIDSLQQGVPNNTAVTVRVCPLLRKSLFSIVPDCFDVSLSVLREITCQKEGTHRP